MALINLLHLGTIDYATALQLQKTLVDLRKQGRIGDTLLLLEHPPVITLGRNSSRSNILVSDELLAHRGVELFESNRGGDVTFHGPGQLVGYPIFDLRGLKLGAVDFVRRIEEALMRTCGDYGVLSQRICKLTGVWTQANQPAKIAAIGIHISRAVTSHGFALNVNTDLDLFKLIVPCGISDKPVTSLEREMASDRPAPNLEQVAMAVARNFGWVFAAQVLWLESLDALLNSANAEKSAHSEPQDTPAKAPKELREFHGEEEIYLA